MFKGFDKAKDIQYVYTPVFSSLCGVKLDYNNKAGYLLSGIYLNQKHTKSSFAYLYFWQEQTAVKKFVFLKGFMFQVGNLTKMQIIAKDLLTLTFMSWSKSEVAQTS